MNVNLQVNSINNDWSTLLLSKKGVVIISVTDTVLVLDCRQRFVTKIREAGIPFSFLSPYSKNYLSRTANKLRIIDDISAVEKLKLSVNLVVFNFQKLFKVSSIAGQLHHNAYMLSDQQPGEVDAMCVEPLWTHAAIDASNLCLDNMVLSQNGRLLLFKNLPMIAKPELLRLEANKGSTMSFDLV